MLDFIYDSLDTVKKMKFPTVKQVAQLTAGIFALVIVAGIYFVLADSLFSDGYKAFYSMMTGKSLTPAAHVMTAEDLSGLTLSGLDFAGVEGQPIEITAEDLANAETVETLETTDVAAEVTEEAVAETPAQD